jgi:hypothetical protein
MRTSGPMYWVGMLIGVTLFASNARAQGDPLTAAKGDLRRLVSLNEVYHAKNKKYASSISDLTGFHPSAGVTVTVGQATANGWSASATAGSAPGKSCVIYVGSVSAPKTQAQGMSGPEAVPTCDK